MRWKNAERSDNVEDRRGKGGAAIAGGGIGAIILAMIVMFLGGDPKKIMQLVGGGGQQKAAAARQLTKDEIEIRDFVSVVLKDTEVIWTEIFAKHGMKYEQPKLVLFEGNVTSGCGRASAAMGPFYCPADKKIYMDPAFYKDLKGKLGAPGDFAQAYVIAHEVGHHVQNLVGLTNYVHSQQRQIPKEQYNKLSVQLELQADFLAGVWANRAHKYRNILERGDIEEALTAAEAIGDDTLQENAQGYARPETFTHGTSAQRIEWFSKGIQTGDVRHSDTGMGPIFRGR